jgi:hypothetical protein
VDCDVHSYVSAGLVDCAVHEPRSIGYSYSAGLTLSII